MTMKKKDELAEGAKGCLAKAAPDEMLFIMRAQDITSPKVVVLWIAENIYSTKTPDDKLREAFECALEMRRHHTRKLPD